MRKRKIRIKNDNSIEINCTEASTMTPGLVNILLFVILLDCISDAVKQSSSKKFEI